MINHLIKQMLLHPKQKNTFTIYNMIKKFYSNSLMYSLIALRASHVGSTAYIALKLHLHTLHISQYGIRMVLKDMIETYAVLYKKDLDE